MSSKLRELIGQTQGVPYMDDILARMGEVQRKSRTLMRRIHSWDAH